MAIVLLPPTMRALSNGDQVATLPGTPAPWLHAPAEGFPPPCSGLIGPAAVALPHELVRSLAGRSIPKPSSDRRSGYRKAPHSEKILAGCPALHASVPAWLDVALSTTPDQPWRLSYMCTHMPACFADTMSSRYCSGQNHISNVQRSFTASAGCFASIGPALRHLENWRKVARMLLLLLASLISKQQRNYQP
jgi:hypothetical protein